MQKFGELKGVNMKEIKNIQIDDETYEICGGGRMEFNF